MELRDQRPSSGDVFGESRAGDAERHLPIDRPRCRRRTAAERPPAQSIQQRLDFSRFGSTDSSGGQPTASVSLPGYLLGGVGNFNLVAQYRGDAAFSAAGRNRYATDHSAHRRCVHRSFGARCRSPRPSTDRPVLGIHHELARTGRCGSGLEQASTSTARISRLAQYFRGPASAQQYAHQPVDYLRNLAYPLVRTFVFSGVDATGQSWSRQATATFLGPSNGTQAVILSAVPLVIATGPHSRPKLPVVPAAGTRRNHRLGADHYGTAARQCFR